MERAFDISGRWRGHYEQDGGKHGITMEVAQRGGSFVGRMRDEDTMMSGTTRMPVVDEEGAEAGVLDLETMGELPEFSIVEGDVEGDHIGFDKRYEGTHTVTAWNEDVVEAQFEITEHRVRYEGQIAPDGSCLRGEWRIPCGDDDGNGDAVGSFELFRQ